MVTNEAITPEKLVTKSNPRSPIAEAYRQRAAAGMAAPRWDAWREGILEGWLAREG